MGCHFLQQIFPTQGLNPSLLCLLHCQVGSLSLHHLGSPLSITLWVAKKYLSEGKVVVFGCGLGIPFLSTDTAGAVRAAEIEADAMFMAKNIDYIYTDDPRKNKDAKKLECVKASEVLALNLKAIDSTATAFCLSVGMPIHVFGLKDPADIMKALRGESVGTVITAE